MIFAALAVRFLTKRFIGEYDSSVGEELDRGNLEWYNWYAQSRRITFWYRKSILFTRKIQNDFSYYEQALKSIYFYNKFYDGIAVLKTVFNEI